MTGNFLRVKCRKCKNEQVIFEKSAREVKCLVCGAVLTRSSGGKSKVDANVLGTVE